jgi:hypothetical protein
MRSIGVVCILVAMFNPKALEAQLDDFGPLLAVACAVRLKLFSFVFHREPAEFVADPSFSQLFWRRKGDDMDEMTWVITRMMTPLAHLEHLRPKLLVWRWTLLHPLPQLFKESRYRLHMFYAQTLHHIMLVRGLREAGRLLIGFVEFRHNYWDTGVVYVGYGCCPFDFAGGRAGGAGGVFFPPRPAESLQVQPEERAAATTSPSPSFSSSTQLEGAAAAPSPPHADGAVVVEGAAPSPVPLPRPSLHRCWCRRRRWVEEMR